MSKRVEILKCEGVNRDYEFVGFVGLYGLWGF